MSPILEKMLGTVIKGHALEDRLQFSAKGRFIYNFSISAKTEIEVDYVYGLLCDAILEYYGYESR